MYKDKADLLVAALRSGEYEQGRSKLRSPDDRFCCLGVASDLAAKAGVCKAVPCEDYGWRYDGQALLLGPNVQKWFGLYRDAGEFSDESLAVTTPRNHLARSLMKMNDDGMTFEEIADFIEANWEKL